MACMAWQIHKEAGNRCFVEGQHVEAEQHYDKALLLASAAGTIDEIGALFSNRCGLGSVQHQATPVHAADCVPDRLKLNGTLTEELMKKAETLAAAPQVCSQI